MNIDPKQLEELTNFLNEYRNVFNEIEDITFKKFIKKNKGELKKIKDTYKLKRFQFKIIIRALYICACNKEYYELPLTDILNKVIEEQAPEYCTKCNNDKKNSFTFKDNKYICNGCNIKNIKTEKEFLTRIKILI